MEWDLLGSIELIVHSVTYWIKMEQKESHGTTHKDRHRWRKTTWTKPIPRKRKRQFSKTLCHLASGLSYLKLSGQLLSLRLPLSNNHLTLLPLSYHLFSHRLLTTYKLVLLCDIKVNSDAAFQSISSTNPLVLATLLLSIWWCQVISNIWSKLYSCKIIKVYRNLNIILLRSEGW